MKINFLKSKVKPIKYNRKGNEGTQKNGERIEREEARKAIKYSRL